MNFEQVHQSYNSNMYASRDKKDVLWNIIEPGDPYDIRRSYVANADL